MGNRIVHTISGLENKVWLWLLIIATIMMFRWGYEFGRNDQMQTAAYAMYLNDAGLFSGDWYIQTIHQHIPNERFAFAWLYSWLGNQLEPGSFILHLLFLFLHLYLWYRIGDKFITRKVFIWAWLLVLFIPLYGIHTGGNELYYRSFFVSNVVKTFGLLGILLALNKRYEPAFLIWGFCTILQPVVGVQLAVVSALATFPLLPAGEYTLPWKRWLRATALYALTGGVWILGLRFFFAEAAADSQLFFKILFEFRVPHHCMPFSFSLKAYALLLVLIVAAIACYRSRSSYLYRFMLIGSGLLLIAIPAVEWLNQVDMTALQWFKLTIWMQAFGLLAVFILLERKVPFLQTPWLIAGGVLLVFFVAVFGFAALLFPGKLSPFNVTYDYLPHMKRDASVRMAETIKTITPVDAVLLHPAQFTELKVYGKRSSAADYKILVHRKATMVEWFERMQDVYGADLETSSYGLAFYIEADAFYFSLDTEQVLALADKYGVTHFLTSVDHVLDLPVWAVNEEFVLYGIR